MKEQGKRSDLLDIKRKVDDGASTVSLWDEHYGSMIRYHKSVKEYKRIKTKPRNSVPTILILWGPSGVGKTQRAKREYPDAYWKSVANWWEDYDGQSTVVFDEFDGSQYKFRELLRVLDSSPYKVECKGSCYELQATTFIFTTNTAPWNWYNPLTIHTLWEHSPLRRRIAEWGRIEWMGEGPAPVYVPGRSINYAPDVPDVPV